MIKLMRFSSRAALAAGLSVAAFGVTAGERVVDCAQPATFIEQRACQKASEGIEALARYIWRTRMVYGLYLPDYLHAVR